MADRRVSYVADPRTRLAVVGVVSTLAILIRDWRWLLALTLLTLAGLALAGAEPGLLLRRARRLGPLLISLLLIQSVFTRQGQPLLSVGGFTLLTDQGAALSASVVLRLAVISLSAIFLLGSEPMELVLGLVKLRVPDEVAFMVLLAIRFLPVLQTEVQDTLIAVQLRGVDLTRIPAGAKLRLYTGFFLPVVAGTLTRARQTALAMEARAFRAYPKRTYVDDLSLSGRDWVTIIAALAGGLAYYIWYRRW